MEPNRHIAVLGQKPPHVDQDLEKHILSVCLSDEGHLTQALDAGLSDKDFFRPGYQKLFRRMVELDRAGEPLNFANFYSSLTESEIAGAGGTGAMAELGNPDAAVMASLMFDTNVRRLMDWRKRHNAWETACETLAGIEAGQNPDEAMRPLRELAEGAEDCNGTRAMTCAEMVKQAVDELGAAVKADGLTGPPTGFPSLDKFTGGLQHGHYYVAGARPGVGKTALALNIALAVAKGGGRVLFLTAEMTPAQLGVRLISITGQVDMGEFRTPGRHPKNGALRQTKKACQCLKKLHIDPLDVSGWSVEQVADAVRLEHRRAPLALVVVDYLGLLKCDTLPAQATQYDTITEVTKGLCRAAKRIDVPLLALCQLNRGAGKDEPMLTDLRQSGQIEQDADMVLLLDRPEMRMPAGEERDKVKGLARLIVAKNRHGEAGMEISMNFMGEYQTFTEQAEP